MGATPSCTCFNLAPHPPSFRILPLPPIIDTLHRCRQDPKTGTHLPNVCRALAAMTDAAQYGLHQMPAVDASIASLVVSPEEAIRQDPCCPCPQCSSTYDLLTKGYDIAARIGCMTNLLSHLALGLSATLQTTRVDIQAHTLNGATLQAIAFNMRDLGRLLSTLMVLLRRPCLSPAGGHCARCWLSQAPQHRLHWNTVCKLARPSNYLLT